MIKKDEFIENVKPLIEEFLKNIKKLNPTMYDTINKDGTIDTPKRVAKAYYEMLSGYYEDSNELVSTTFETTSTGCVEVVDIPFYSLCEHHMLPFFGVAKISYKPKNGKVVGLSKLNRLVENESRKLRTQEQLTEDIANVIMTNLKPHFVEVEIEARHMCVEMRGINQRGSTTKTVCKKYGIE